MFSKKFLSKTLNALSALALSGVFLGSGFITPSWAMLKEDEGDAQDIKSTISFSSTPIKHLSSPSENLERLLQFQRKSFLIPSEDLKNELRTQKQEELEGVIKIYPAPQDYKDFVSYHIVEGMAEVAKILNIMPASDKTHRMGFLDLDETLLFSGGLGWINGCFATFMEKQTEALQLLSKYGFSSLDAFHEWGNLHFQVPVNQVLGRNFYNQTNVLDPNVPGILQTWYDQGMNLFGLTSRSCIKIIRTYTKENLKEVEINMAELSRVSIENTEAKFVFRRYIENGEEKFVNSQYIDSGIIYSPYNKFGIDSSGIKFLKAYLKKLSTDSSLLQNYEIIIVDNCRCVFMEIICPSNIDELKKLEKEFKIKLHFKFFLPIEESWLAPHHPDIWHSLKRLENGFDPETTALQALQEFLDTFKGAL